MERRFLGLVEVDSGTLLVGDPGYVLPWSERGKPGVDYAAVIAAVPSAVAGPLAGTPTLLIQDFGGDGTFPVFGEFDGPDLMRLIVEFVELEEE